MQEVRIIIVSSYPLSASGKHHTPPPHHHHLQTIHLLPARTFQTPHPSPKP